MKTVARDASRVNSNPRPISPAAQMPLLVDPAGAARLLSVDRSTIYKLMDSGLASFRIGRARRISVHEIERWIAAQERTGEEARDGSA
jgi:excisionase family DNA binding protein